MRSKDKPILDAALRIAKSEGSDITNVFRDALAEFVRNRGSFEGRIDEFLEDSALSDPIYRRVLTPAELKARSDIDLVAAAKLIRFRKEEIDSELRRRGFFFRW